MISYSPQETIEYGRQFAKKLKGGEVIGLKGELGSGKTTFIKGLAKGLKIQEIITSPTFVILKTYPAKIGQKKIKLAHLDCYRLKSIQDAKSIGIEDYLGRKDTIVVIEWPEKISKILPKNIINIHFKHLNPSQRKIIIVK
ncbi:MAG: tRNA (adenosine(37)-N6)-threonylcarbamoyltransferase complex ATPase subunit type 1 TsaE [Patescibacteria group bacterium]